MKKIKFDKRLIAAFLAIVLFLGVNFVAVKFSNKELPPFWGASLRFIIASVILLSFIKIKQLPLPKGKALIGASLFGLLAFGAGFGLLYTALIRLTAGTASIIFATIPLMTLIFAYLVSIEKLTLKRIAGAIIVIIGISLVFNEQLKLNVPFIYLILVVLAAMSAAASSIVIKYFPKSHPISTNAVGMAVGAIVLIFASFLSHEVIRIPYLIATWIALAWLVGSSIIAFVLMVWVLSKWSASATSYSAVLSPLVTVTLASFIAGERISLLFLIGGSVVLLGIYIGVLSNQK